MMKTGLRLRNAGTAGVLAVAMMVSGCGFDGVELNGALFDYMGVSGNSGPKKEPKVAERLGLVLPPQMDRLPEPGAAPTQTASIDPAWPVDPDGNKAAQAAALDRQHDAFCRDALWRAKAAGQTDAQIKGPKGMCNASALNLIAGKNLTTSEPSQ